MSFVSRQNGRALAAWVRPFVAVADFLEQVRDRLAPCAYVPRSTATSTDHVIAAGMGLVAIAIAFNGIVSIDPRIYDTWNIYFQGDGYRVLADMSDRFSAQWRTNVHPIFSILTYPFMHALMALGLELTTAAEVLLMACAATSGALFYLALRGLGLPKVAAVAFNAAFLTSATFIHWYAYVETYAFAATSIVAVLYVMTSSRSTWLWGWALASAGALAVTITSWALALAGGFFRLPFLVFVRLSALVLLVVAGIACLQSLTFPTSSLFFNPLAYKNEHAATQLWLQRHGYADWTPSRNVRSALITSAVAPPPVIEDAPTPVGVFRLVNNQNTPILQSSFAGLVAVACWLFLLGAGVWGAWRDRSRWAIAIPIVAYLASQLAIYVVYGEITFLYAGNFFPALMMLTAFAWFTPLRNVAVGAALAFALFAGINNHHEFQRAAHLSGQIAAHLAETGEALCIPTCDSAKRGQ